MLEKLYQTLKRVFHPISKHLEFPNTLLVFLETGSVKHCEIQQKLPNVLHFQCVKMSVALI